MQEVALDSKIMLLDSPGIVMATGDASDTTIALRNALRIDNLEDAIAPVEVILKRTGKEYVNGIFVCLFCVHFLFEKMFPLTDDASVWSEQF